MKRLFRSCLPVLLLAMSAASLVDVGVASALSGDGTGTMTVNPTSVAASSMGNSLTFTYTLTATLNTSAEVQLIVPTGWVAPTSTNTSVSTSCSVGESSGFSGQTVTVTLGGFFQSCSSGNTITLVYGTSGHTLTAPSGTGPYTFTTKSANYNFGLGTLTAIATSPIVTVYGPASQLVFGQQPSNVYVGVSMSPAATVLIEDSGGNVISSTSSIALTVTTNPCGGSPVVTNGTASAVSGTATFSGLQISKECAGYVLTATDASDSGIFVVSSPFTVSALVTNSANALQDAATDTGGSAMNSVTYYYCSGFSTSCSESPGDTIGSSTTSPNYQVSWSSLPANGPYTLYAVATDHATNSTTSSPGIPVTVDGNGPTGGSISVPNYAKTLSVTITTTNYSDSASGIASNVITRSNGQAPTAGVCPTSNYTGATTGDQPGHRCHQRQLLRVHAHGDRQ